MEGFYALTVHNLFWQNSKFHLFPDLKFPYWDMIKKIRQLWLSWERKLSHLANLTWDVEVWNRKQLIFIDVIFIESLVISSEPKDYQRTASRFSCNIELLLIKLSRAKLLKLLIA